MKDKEFKKYKNHPRNKLILMIMNNKEIMILKY